MSSSHLTPLLDLALDHPHSLGYIADGDRDYGFDLSFGDPASTVAAQLRGLSGAPQLHYADEWAYTNTEYVPEVNGVRLKPSISWTEETTARWSGTGSYWHVITPPGEQAAFIEWYHAGIECPEVTSAFELPQNQPFVLTCIYLASSAGLDLRVEWDPSQVRGWNRRFELDQPNDRVRWYDVENAAELRRYSSPAWKMELHEGLPGRRRVQLWFEPLDDWLVVRWGNLHGLVYYERDLQLPDHKLKLSFGGRRVAWNLSYLDYPTTGTRRVARREQINWSDPFDGPSVLYPRAYEIGSAQVSDASIYPGGAITVQFDLTTDSPNRTPVLYGAYGTHDPTLVTPGGLPATQQLEEVCESLIIDYRRLRGHMATVRLNDFDVAHSVFPNSLLTINANWDDGGGETANLQQFLGYAERRATRQDGVEYAGELMWEMRFVDASAKFAKKRCFRHPHYGAWGAGNFFTRLARAAGVAPGSISVGSPAPTLPGDRDERLLAFDAEVPLDEAADRGLETVRWEWGIDFYPTYSVYAQAEPQYAGVYATTLDEDTSTDDEVIESIRYHTDLEGFANFCWIRERNADGSFGAQWAYYAASVDDDTDDYFVGDWVDRVEGRPDVTDAVLYAKKLLAEGKQNVGILEWTWARAHMTIFPGDYVRCQCPNVVANNSVFLITNLRRTFDHRDNNAFDEVTAVRVA